MKKEERLVHKIKRLIRQIGLPRWLHHYGPKKYEFWHHLLALVVRQLCQLSYRRASWLLNELGMKVPSYSALAKMSKRLPSKLWQRLLAATHSNAVNVAALDSTYFARSNPSYHYLRRIDQRGPPGIPVKANVLVDTRSKKVLAAKIRVLPAGDCRDVVSVLKHCKPRILVADKGYDSEAVHEHCFDQGIISMIPKRITTKRGFYRHKMLKTFRLRTYHRREMSESKFSSIKRTLGSIARCRRARTIRAELLTKFIASNISFWKSRLFQQSRAKPKIFNKGSSARSMESTIWTEKYRPKSFDDVKGQEEVVKRVKAFVKHGNMPHLLFTGPAGIGKTTLSLVIARSLYGDSWKNNFLELNASDERGIDVVRNTVKDFARTKAIGDVPFKLIYLDECDALTKEAQQALRRTMENYTSTCRFILSCNYSSKIIDPIQSRCAIFRFKPLSDENMKMIIKQICANEGLKIDESVEKALLAISEGDCRRLENILQSCAAISKEITAESIFAMASYAEPKEVQEFLELALKKQFDAARNKLQDVMLRYGLSGIDIIKQIQKEIWKLNIKDQAKIVLIDKCGEIEFRMVEGADEFVQLEAFLAQIALTAV